MHYTEAIEQTMFKTLKFFQHQCAIFIIKFSFQNKRRFGPWISDREMTWNDYQRNYNRRWSTHLAGYDCIVFRSLLWNKLSNSIESTPSHYLWTHLNLRTTLCGAIWTIGDIWKILICPVVSRAKDFSLNKVGSSQNQRSEFWRNSHTKFSSHVS